MDVLILIKFALNATLEIRIGLNDSFIRKLYFQQKGHKRHFKSSFPCLREAKVF